MTKPSLPELLFRSEIPCPCICALVLFSATRRGGAGTMRSENVGTARSEPFGRAGARPSRCALRHVGTRHISASLPVYALRHVETRHISASLPVYALRHVETRHISASLPVRPPSCRDTSHQYVVSVAMNCDPPATSRVQHTPCARSRCARSARASAVSRTRAWPKRKMPADLGLSPPAGLVTAL